MLRLMPADSLDTRGRGATPDPLLAPSLAYCRHILDAKARSFAFAARFLPEEQRWATQAMYALFRTVDDIADGSGSDKDPRAMGALEGWRRWVVDGCTPEPSDPIRYAVSWAVSRFALRRDHVIELMEGVRDDLGPRRLATAADLERYCYQVAATVGLTMAGILGATHPDAPRCAADLGIAMQLTNIIRDVGEDASRGRVYLPRDEILAFGYSYERLAAGTVDDPFVALLRHQIRRARAYYRRASSGIGLIPAGARFPIRLAATLYEGILGAVERNGFDVFRKRAHVGPLAKLWVATRLSLRGSRPRASSPTILSRTAYSARRGPLGVGPERS